MSSNFATRWLGDLRTGLGKCARRFPAAVFFIAALTCWLLCLSHDAVPGDDRLTAAITYYLSVGIPLSVMLQLWREEMESRARQSAVQTTGQVLLAADAVFLYICAPTAAIIIAHAAAVAAIVIAAFIIPFYREKGDVPFWNFAWKTAVAYIKALAAGMLLTGGMELLLFSVAMLFAIDIPEEIYFDVSIIFNVGLATLFFIGLLPAGAAKHDSLPRTNEFLRIMVRYVFIPLVACYAAVLYAYAARILVMWQLPDGYVSWLVTALVAGCVAIEAGLYPFRQFPVKKKSDELIARWLPMLIMPLLVLMTIGIVRRFGDYGITVTRLYLAAFNLWCYAVCITLFVTRARRISWIPASFATVFLLTSVLPGANFASITLNTLRGDIEAAMEQTCTDTPPLSEEQYSNWINNTLPEEEGQRINDKFLYLADMYDSKAYSHLAADSIYFYSYKLYDDEVDTINVGDYYGFYATLSDGIDIPADATRITEVEIHGYDDSARLAFSRDERLPVEVAEGDTIYIDFPTLDQLNDADYNTSPYTELPQNHDGFKFVLTEIAGRMGDNDSIHIGTIRGYLFNIKDTIEQ